MSDHFLFQNKWKIPGALLIPGFLTLILVLNAQETARVFESPLLLAVLNTVFLCVIPLGMAYLAAKSYQSSGVFAFLLVGSGFVVFGVSSFYAGWVMPLAGGPNPTVTLHNLGSLCAGLCQLVGTYFFLRELIGHASIRPRVRKYRIVFSLIIGLVTLVAFLAYRGILPVFFNPALGPSPLRQLVLGGAIAFFAVAGFAFLEIYALTKTDFAFWYGVSLWLIAIGLGAVLLQHGVGSPVGWAGRAAQYLGCAGFIAAFLQGKWELSPTGPVSTIRSHRTFWPYLEEKVRERTLALSQANDAIQKEINEGKRAEVTLQARLRIIEYAENHTLAEMLQNALDEFCALSDSPVGFFHFVEADEVTISLRAWSTRTQKEMCKAEGSGTHYDIGRAGVWADCVRERRPIIHNDYSSLPNRKGLPAGHAPLTREMVFPIVRNEKIVAIIGVGNKTKDYTDGDVAYASHLADLIWDLVERKRADEQIKRSLAEKEVLLRELYHRTKNNMAVIIALLGLQSDYFDDERLRQAFVEAQNRVRSMALVHQKLSEAHDLSRINLKDYFNDLVRLTKMGSKITPAVVSMAFDMEDVYALIDTAIPCGLMINELLSNALKYAFPAGRAGQIRISLHRASNEEIEIFVADDGVGVPSGFDVRRDGRLGIQTILNLGERQLQGLVVFDVQNGLSFRITFSDSVNQARV